jgi:hypothetical protein
VTIETSFCHDYTSLGVWPRDHYMLLERSTTGVCHTLLWFPGQIVPACSFPQKRPLLHHVVQTGHKVCHNVYCHFHSTEHDTQPISYLISKQVVPHRTHGSTCCLGASTPKIQSLADSITTCDVGINHLPIPTIGQTTTLILTMVNSHLDGWETISHKDTSQIQHHKG